MPDAPCLQAPERPLRSACCYENGIMLLDTSTHIWTIRYANFAVCNLTGLHMPLVEGEDLWSLFGVEEVVGCWEP